MMNKFFYQLKNLLNGDSNSEEEVAPISSSTTTPMNKPNNLNEKKIRLIVEGRVQGVGFRYTTKQAADRIGVFGIVRNENDGSVYIEVNGDPQKVDRFIEEIRHSPSPSGKVDHVTLEEDASIEERVKFSITN